VALGSRVVKNQAGLGGAGKPRQTVPRAAEDNLFTIGRPASAILGQKGAQNAAASPHAKWPRRATKCET